MSRDGCIELARTLGLEADDVIEWWLERSSVREYDGGLTREAAEAAALEDARVHFDPLDGAVELASLRDAKRIGPKAAPTQLELPLARKHEH
jgi:hypothetical protein